MSTDKERLRAHLKKWAIVETILKELKPLSPQERSEVLTAILHHKEWREETTNEAQSLDHQEPRIQNWSPMTSYYHNVLKEKEDRFCQAVESGLHAYNQLPGLRSTQAQADS